MSTTNDVMDGPAGDAMHGAADTPGGNGVPDTVADGSADRGTAGSVDRGAAAVAASARDRVQGPPGHAGVDRHSGDDPEEHPDDGEDVGGEYSDGALLASIFSAPSLALAGFVFAFTGLLGGMIPDSLPYLVQVDPAQGPAHHVRMLGLISLGLAVVAASLGLAAMLRSIGSPLRWPRYLASAAVVLAVLIALQAVLLIVLARVSGPAGTG